MENLAKAVREGYVLVDPEAENLRDVLSQVVSMYAANGIIPVEQQPAVLQELLDRQQRVPTATAHGVAIPHAYMDGIVEPVIAIVRLKQPIDMGAPDGVPTRLLFVLLGPSGDLNGHIDNVTTIWRLVTDKDVRYEIREARSVEDVGRALQEYTKRIAISPSDVASEVTPGLSYTGRICGGLVADVVRRVKHYVADFRDGLHAKSVTATLFLYFACLAPAVTFGGLMFGATGGAIGTTEMLVATAVGGVIYALFSGHPLIILGGTGPLLVFTAILYQLCESLSLPFLGCYAWVGLWTGVFTILLAVTEASCLIRYFTRFTDEIFAALISMIFIVEALKSIIGYVGEARQADLPHDVAFLSLIMALGTFAIAMLLSRLRGSPYLGPTAREFLADFGPTLAIVALIGFGLLFPGVEPERLDVPDSFSTSSGRSWLVPFTSVPTWVWFAAAGPALLATLLIYLDQNITARLVNNPDHGLHKGEGYHLDLFVVGALTAAFSFFGLPWLVAATVRSLNHVRAMATVTDSVDASGDRSNEIVHVRETRITGLAVHVLIGASLFLLPLLQSVPKPVLYGLFLYMGVVSIAGNQFFERIGLWLRDSDLYPRTHYIRSVPMWTIHKFTFLQVCCLVILWGVKISAIAILFPLFIALLVPVRLLANRFFKAEDLTALDAEQSPEEEELEWG